MSDQLGINEFAEVHAALWDARSKWYNIGICLKVKDSDLECINAESGIEIGDKFNRMIRARLKMMEPCTWGDLFDVLNHPTVNEPNVADEVRRKRVVPPPSPKITLETPSVKTANVKENTEKEVTATREKIDMLTEHYNDIVIHAEKEMGNRPVFKLQLSVLSCPPPYERENKYFVKEIEAELKKVESVKDMLLLIAGRPRNYLNYSLLKYLIEKYGNSALKKKMAAYIELITTFRKETRLQVFSEVYEVQSEEENYENVALELSKHDIDWDTATLEDVEEYRIDHCRELSLYKCFLDFKEVAHGCVEITWQIPRSLVAYIQRSIKPSSPSMMKHHVSTLTIDGFIVYDSTTAMQNEHKVIRLELQAIHVNYSYMLDELSPDGVVPHLVKRRLLSPAKAEEVNETSSQLGKVSTILQALCKSKVVGRLHTFCAALISAGLPHIAEKITDKFQCLLKDEIVSYPLTMGDLMISEGASPLPLPPPPESCLITAQVEGTTLTRAQYTTISSLTCSMLCVPTGALVYDGHTSNPLTLHWHCSADGTRNIEPVYSIGLLSEMAKAGIQIINLGMEVEIPQRNAMKFFEAAWDGNVESTMCILESGVSVDITGPNGASSLMVASQNGHVEVVDKLLQHGARADLQEEDGWHPLMFASLNGHVEVVDKLLQHGARVDLQIENGASSLMVASQNGHVEVVDKLLQHGARVNLQEKNGWDPLMFASQNGHVEVVDKLLQHGAKVDLQTKTCDTALIVACMKNDFATVSALLRAGANPTVCNKDGQTPLYLAIRKNNTAVVRELIDAGVDVNYMEEGGMSPLMLCCEDGNSEMAELLLTSHANPDLQETSTGFTALMFANMGGHLDTVITLLKHGANSQIRNRECMTAADVASVNEDPDLCEVLQLMGTPSTDTSDDSDDVSLRMNIIEDF